MRTALLLAALCGAVTVPARAQETLLIGRVERITMMPTNAKDCPPACPLETTLPDGRKRICISNSAGCEETVVDIDRVLLGEAAADTRTFHVRIGEWGQPLFQVSHTPILIHVGAQGEVRWTRLEDRAGAAYFDAKRLKNDTIGGVAIAALTPDADGAVPLDDLLARVQPIH